MTAVYGVMFSFDALIKHGMHNNSRLVDRQQALQCTSTWKSQTHFMGLGSSFLSHNYDIESTGRGRGNIVTKDAGLLTNLTSSDICVIWSPQ